MKKLVPDPPRQDFIQLPSFSLHPNVTTSEILAHASELLRGVAETIEQHRRVHPYHAGLNMLANAAHTADASRVLIDYAVTCLPTKPEDR
ncbi:MAG: hypothetical protein EOO16_18080 [Chitinophagaceae bacterium]|nr:MAG: hypothetical protein EOO16_18080 [Chitinophagaceae bacterium]